MREDVFEKVTEILAEAADIGTDEIGEECSLMEELGLNSMEVISCVGQLEKAYRIRIPEKDMRSFASVRDIIDYICGKI